MHHCSIDAAEGKWYLPSAKRSYFMRDRARVSLAGSAFLFCVFLCWYKIYWEFDRVRQIIYFTCCESNWWYFVTVKNVPGLLGLKHLADCLNCWLFEQQLPQCPSFLGNMSKDANYLWPVCLSAGTEPLAAWCGSSLPFCRVLFAPHTSLGKKSMQIISSEILAFSPSLKGWGVPQAWCLILAKFLSSIQV